VFLIFSSEASALYVALASDYKHRGQENGKADYRCDKRATLGVVSDLVNYQHYRVHFVAFF
jgi:hypothetical protein